MDTTNTTQDGALQQSFAQQLATKVLAVQSAMAKVAKNKKNQHFNYSYADLTAIERVLKPQLKAQGLLVRAEYEDRGWDTVQKYDRNTGAVVGIMSVNHLNCYLVVTDTATGYWERFGGFPGNGADEGDKGPYKAMTTTLRYALMYTFLLEVSEQGAPSVESDDASARMQRAANRQPAATGKPAATQPAAEPATWEELKAQVTAEELDKAREWYKADPTLTPAAAFKKLKDKPAAA